MSESMNSVLFVPTLDFQHPYQIIPKKGEHEHDTPNRYTGNEVVPFPHLVFTAASKLS